MERIAESTTQEINPRWEILTEDGAPILIISLPGFKKEELKVRVKGAELTIEGLRAVDSNRKEHFEERYEINGCFKQQEIKAKFRDEIVTITMPKKTELVPKYPPKHQIVDKQQQPEKVHGDTTAKRQEEERVRSRSKEEKLLEKGKEQSNEAIEESPKKGSGPGNVVADNIPEIPAAAEAKSSGNAEEKDFVKNEEGQALASEMSETGVLEAVDGRDDDRTAENLEYMSWKRRTSLGEDRVLLVNAAIALLILVAEAAYISYTAWAFA